MDELAQHPYRALCEATRDLNSARKIRNALGCSKAAHVALRRALVFGTLRSERDDDVRALAEDLATAQEALADVLADARNLGIAQGTGAAILTGALLGHLPAWLSPFFVSTGISLAMTGAAFALLVARYGHHVDRLGKTIEELRRYCSTLPPSPTGPQGVLAEPAVQSVAVPGLLPRKEPG